VNPATAQKLVLLFVAGGAVMVFFTVPSSQPGRRYRTIWGLSLLGIATAAAADFAPALVGPFLGLVLVAYAAGHHKQLATVSSQVRQQATGKG
jgi:hypothetical protein